MSHLSMSCFLPVNFFYIQVVDFCHFSRETVTIAMSILDRFLMTQQGRSAIFDSAEFQLAAMTSLYTAVKIHEPEVMSSNLVSTLSRGAHTDKEVEVMERRILQAIKWHVNPPTSLSFIREFLNLLPPEFLDESTKTTLYEISKYQSELVVADYALVSIPASTIAYASLINALEGLCMDRVILGYAGSILAQAAGIEVPSAALTFVQVQLCDAVTKQTQPQHQQQQNTTPTSSAPTQAAPSSCGMDQKAVAPRRSSYKASPCTVTRMEL